eukprot:5844734-Pyramimonas_sp.AAC.1
MSWGKPGRVSLPGPGAPDTPEYTQGVPGPSLSPGVSRGLLKVPLAQGAPSFSLHFGAPGALWTS